MFKNLKQHLIFAASLLLAILVWTVVLDMFIFKWPIPDAGFDQWLQRNGNGLEFGPAVINSCKRIDLYSMPFEKPELSVNSEEKDFEAIKGWVISRVEHKLNYHRVMPSYEPETPQEYLVLYSSSNGAIRKDFLMQMVINDSLTRAKQWDNVLLIIPLEPATVGDAAQAVNEVRSLMKHEAEAKIR